MKTTLLASIACGSLFCILAPGNAHAANLWWDANGSATGAGGATPTGTWGTDAYWSTSSAGTVATTAWTSGETAIFSAGTDATGTFAVTLSGTQTAGGVTFDDGTPTLSGDALSLIGTGVINVPSSTRKGIIASSISGSVGLTKAGAGDLVLSGANSFSGGLTLQGGTLTLDNDSAASSSTITFDNSSVPATLRTTKSLTTLANSIDLGSSSFDVGLAADTGAKLVLNGVIDGSVGFTTKGPGTVVLGGSAANTFPGAVLATQGTLILAKDVALGSTLNGTVVSSGATLGFQGGFKYKAGEALTINGSGAGGVGAINNFSGLNEFWGTVNLNSASAIGADSGALKFLGPVSGNYGLTKVGSGTVDLRGQNNNYTTTLVSAGTLGVWGLANAGTGLATVSSGATLEGTGSVPGGVDLFGTISPGVSPGTLNTGSQTWEDGAVYEVDISDFLGTAGTYYGWDLLNVTGGLTINSSSASPVTIRIFSQDPDDNLPGDAVGFNNTLEQDLVIARTTTGITGFDSAEVTIDDTEFSNDLGGGRFVILTSGNDLVLRFDPPPVITLCENKVQANDTGNCSASVTFAATATDNDTATPPIFTYKIGSTPIESPHTFLVGETTVDVTATDSVGNTATCSFTVKVNDTQLPTITAPPALTDVHTDAGACTVAKANVPLGTPTTGDNCGVASVVNNAPDPFPKGTTEVTWTVTDTHGNTAQATQSVTVQDHEAPVITGCPADFFVLDPEGDGQVATWTAPTDSDNCAVTAFTSNYDPGDSFPVGTTTVTYTAKDAAGNTTTCSFDVTVVSTTACFVDDSYGTLPPGTPVDWPYTGTGTHYIGYDAFATIQGGVDAVSSGGTVNVAGGNYAENIVVSKPLALLGPNNGTAGNGVRGPEAIIMPASSAITSGELIHVAASGVSIRGFTLDGDNPALTSGYLGTNDADIDAAEGVTSYETNINNLTVSNNIIRNLSYFGVTLYDYPAGSATSGHLVSGNLIEHLGTYDAGSGIAKWGGGVLLYNNQYTRVTGNVMVNVRIGIQTGNFSRANPGAADYQVIDGNTMSCRRVGIFHNLHYGPTSPYTLSNNSITGLAHANEAGVRGILLGSLSVASTCQGNTIDIAAVSTPTSGYEVWNVKSTSPATITGGSVTGTSIGLFLNNFEGYSSDATDGAHALVSGLTISPKADGIGIEVRDSTSSTAHAAVSLSLGTGVTVSGGGTGLRIANSAASVSALADTAFTGQTGDYIELASNVGNLDATAASFDGKLGSAMTLAELFATEDKIQHKVDDATLGLVRVKALNLYVTTSSGSIQRGINGATAGDTVNVDAGTFTENVTVNKLVALLGAGSSLAGTLVDPAGSAALLVSGSGTSGTPLVLRGLRVAAAANYGVHLSAGAVEHVRIEDCYLSSSATGSRVGIRTGSAVNLRHIAVVNVEFAGNIQDVYFSNDTLANASVADDILFESCAFSGTQKGIYVEKLSNALIKCCTFNNVGNDSAYVWSTGVDVNLKWADYANITIQDSDFVDCAIGSKEGAAIAIKARGTGTDTGYASRPATLAGVHVKGCVVSGNERGVRFGEPGKNNTGPTGVVVENCVITGNVKRYAGSDGSAYGGLVNLTTAVTMADDNWWGHATGPALAANVGGAGDALAGPADFSPWLGAMINLASSCGGFQPDAATPLFYTPHHLVFSQQPGNAQQGVPFGRQPFVQVIDENNGVASQFVGNVTMALRNNPSGATLGGTLTVAASNGIATFLDLSLDKGGSGFTLIASAASPILSQESDPFNVSIPAVVYVDDNYTPSSSGGHTWGYDAFAAIQPAINAVSAGGIVNVAVGDYAENVVVTKPLALLGPNAANAGCTGRVAEAVVVPAVNDPSWAGAVILIQAANVTVAGFTVDGDNSALTGGVDVNGVDANAGQGITTTPDGGSTGYALSGVVVRNNVIRNLTCAAFYGYATNPSGGNVVSGNCIDNLPLHGPTYYGWGIVVENNFYGQITGNKLTRVRTGIQIDNTWLADPVTETPTIADNDISYRWRGILHNLQYQDASAWTISGNTITAAPDAIPLNGGLRIWSIQSAVGATIQNNNVSGAYMGIEIWNVPTTSTITVQGGTLSGNTYGVRMTDHSSYGTASPSKAVISGITIQNSTTAGIAVDSTAHSMATELGISGVTVTGGPVGLLADGTGSKVTPAGLGASSFSGQTGNYVTFANGACSGQEVDATAASFDGKLGSAMTLAELFATEDKIAHELDNAALGLVRVKALNLYVTTASGSIQRGIDAATAGDTVNVGAGTFTEQLEMAMDITVDGQGATTIVKSPATLPLFYTTSANNKPVVHVHDTASAVIRDLTVDGDGQGNANYRFMGVSYYRAGGLVQNVNVKGVRDTPFSGAQHCIAIYGYADVAATRNLEVTGCTVFDFQKNGITINGAYLVGNVHGNTVTGAGPTGVTAQNGIQFGYGATGTIADNEVSGLAYTGSGWSAAGVLVYQSGVSITGNKVNGCQDGINVTGPLSSMGRVANNDLSGNQSGLWTDSGAPLVVVNNWWGDRSGPSNASLNYYGTGVGVGGNVTLSPWLANDTDTSTDIGFQPGLDPDVNYIPTHLAFSTQPVGAPLGSPLSTQPIVQVQDAFETVTPWAQPNVGMVLAVNPGSGTLTGTIPKPATLGVATFTDLTVTGGGGSGVILEASAPSLTSATSAPFDIGNPRPVLTSLNPAGAVTGSGGGSIPVTVSGSDFVPTSVVNVGGSPAPTVFNSASRLTATLATTPAATYSVTVVTPAAGGGPSVASLPFTVGAQPVVVYVDDGYGPGTSDPHVWGYDAFATIADGIAAVSPGGTVHVAAGSYAATVANKPVILLGANAGTACGGSGVSVINGGAGIAVDITSDGVTLNGFKLTGAIGVRDDGHEGVAIINNLITAAAVGVQLQNIAPTASAGVTVENNCVANLAQLAGSTPSAGVAIAVVTGDKTPIIKGNSVSGAFYGYLVYAANAAEATTIEGGTVTGVMQGVAVINVDPDPAPPTVYLPSTFEVDGVSMSAFAGDYTGVPALAPFNFHSGVYVFTGGADTSATVEGTITDVTVHGTGRISPDSAGLSFADFSTLSGSVMQDVSVQECTLQNNLNRGINIRGANAEVDVTRCTLANNGGDPYGVGGNDGFAVIARTGALLTVEECFITQPDSVVGGRPVTALAAHVGAQVTAFGNAVDNNACPTGRLGHNDGDSGSLLNASGNWWGGTSDTALAALMTGSVDFTPYLGDGTDTAGGTPGFQGDFSTLHVTASLAQTGTTGRIQEGIDLVSGSAVIVEAGTYDENVLANRDNLELIGRGQGATIIRPALSSPDCGGSPGASLCPGHSSVILVRGNNVTIHDLTVDGDNPALTSGIVRGGADLDARNGIITDHASGVWDDLEVHAVSVLNVYLRGIYASSGGSFNLHHNTVRNVQGEANSVAIMVWMSSGVIADNIVSDANDAIAGNHSTGTQFLRNVVTASGSGIHSDNNGSSGGVADLLEGNQVSAMVAGGYGVWVFAPYRDVVVRTNVVSNCSVGLACAGQQAAVAPVFELNTVSAGAGTDSIGVYETTSLFGWGSADAAARFERNSISGTDYGFYLEAEPDYDLAANIGSNNAITYNRYGVYASGALAKARIENNRMTANTAAAIAATGGALVDAGDCTGANITGLGASVGGNTLTGYLSGPAKAVVDLNTAGQPDVLAHNNIFGQAPGGLVTVALSDLGPGNSRVLATEQGALDVTPPGAVTVECVADVATVPGVMGSGVAAFDAFFALTPAGGKAWANDGTIAYVDGALTPGPFEGTITRTYTITDACGEVKTCNQVITVHDGTPPEITTCPADRPLGVGALCNVAVPHLTGEVVATDNCTANPLLITQDPVAGTPISLGTHLVTITVKDQGDNIDTCVVTLTVEDNNPAPLVVHVDDDYATLPAGTVVKFPVGGTGDDHYIGCDAFATIQDGVDRVASPGTVNVAAGIYAENVVANKPVTLLGANAGTACGGRGDSVINGGVGTAVSIAATDVTLDGFALAGATGVSNLGYTGAVIQNNLITAVALGAQMQGIAGAFTVKDNCVDLPGAKELSGNPTIGIMLAGLSGAGQVVDGNTVTGPFYGYLLADVDATTPLAINAGTITAVMQGVAVVNYNAAFTAQANSTFTVDGVTMSGFTGTSANAARNFHAGVYVYTGGPDPSATVVGTIKNVTISGTGKIQQDSAGLSFADFSTGAGVRQDITVQTCTIQNNLNRGINIRGANAELDVTRCTLANNGNDPIGTGGNDGFGIIARLGAQVNVTETFITNPATQAGSYSVTALAIDAGTGTGPVMTVSNSSIDNNGNTAGKLAMQASGTLNGSGNWWSGTTDTTIAALMSGTVDFTPYLASGTDTSSIAGFQGDFSTLHVTALLAQTGATGRIQEGIGLVTAGGTVNVAAGVYSGNIAVNKSVTVLGDPGDCCPGPAPGAPIIDGGSLPGDAFRLANGVSHVTIRGFEIRHFTSDDTGVGNGVQAWQPSTSYVTVSDNHFHHLGWDAIMTGNDGAKGVHTYWTVENNVLEHYDAYGFEFTNTSHSEFASNVIHMTGYDDVPWLAIFVSARINMTAITIRGNAIDGTQYLTYPPVYVYAYDNDTPNPNLNGLLIENNVITTTGAGAQVYVRDINTGTVTGVDLYHNSFSRVRNTTALTVDASENWWGQSSGPGPGQVTGAFTTSPWIAAYNDDPAPACPGCQPGFLPVNIALDTPVIIASAVPDPILCGEPSGSIEVAFSGGTAPCTVEWAGTGSGSASGVSSPYTIAGLAAGTYDITVTDTYGYEASLAGVVVQYLPVSNLTKASYYPTIQAAVDAAEAGNVIQVCAGTYAEDVVVNQPSTIQGAGAGLSIVAGVPGGSLATFDLNAAGTVLTGFTITRQGNNPGAWNNDLNQAGVAIQTVGGMTIECCRFEGNRTAIDINDSDASLIRNNDIVNNRTGLVFRNGCLNNQVSGNTINDNWTIGVLWLDGSPDSAAGTQLAGNSIAGNWYGEIEDRRVGGDPWDASGNWLGTVAPVVVATEGGEPGYSALIPLAFGGTAAPPPSHPTIKGSASANIDCTPWLDVGTDTLAGCGFQGDLSTLHVDDDSPQVGGTGRIQEAIGLVTASTIYLHEGTYVEGPPILVDKDVSIIGDASATTIINPAGDTGTDDDARGWFVIADGKTFNLEEVTLDGAGKKIYHAIRHKGVGTIANCVFANIQYEASGPAYQGTAIAVHTSGNVDVTDCSFSGIGRNGVAAYDIYWPLPATGPTGTYSGNTYTGKGPGDWLDYAFLIQGGASVTIENNQISDCVGVASVDSSGSSGIAVWDDPDTKATVTGNTLVNNSVGLAVAVWYGGGTDPEVVVGAGNTFTGGEVGLDFENVSGALAAAPAVTIGASTFKGQSGAAIAFQDDISAGHTFDISTAVFKTVGDVVITDNFDVEDSVYHGVDAYDRGLLVWNPGHVYVTPNSGSIQRGVDAASAGWTVHVKTGAYAGNVVLNKTIDLSAGASPAQVTVDGDLTLGSSDTLVMELGGLTPGTQHDQWVVNGAVDLGGATLDTSATYAYAGGDTVVLIGNDGTDDVVGTFAGLGNGALVSVSGQDFTIWYNGGTGNDVVLFRSGGLGAFAEVWVDHNFSNPVPGADPDGAGPAQYYLYDSFPTVQGGVNGVLNGGIVNVAAGTYSENVTVSRPLTLKGANLGKAGCAGRDDESTINGGTGTALTIAADDVTVDGFAMEGLTGIRARSHIGVVVRNNKVLAGALGIDAGTVATTSDKNLALEGNCVALATQGSGTAPTVGIVLTGVSGDQAPLVSGNFVSGGFYGYALYDVQPAAPTVVFGGTVTGVKQGVAVANSQDFVTFKPTTFGVDGVQMTGFTGDHPATPGNNFHAGVYVYTGGADAAAKVTGLVKNLTVAGTGKIQGDCAALNFSDYSTVLGSTLQDISVQQCTITGNLNRGVNVRGANALVSLLRCTLTDNGADPIGTGGNHGFGIIARRGATVNVTECFLTNPASQAGYTVTALALDAGGTVTAFNNAIDNNGNTAGRLAMQSSGTFDASANWWADNTLAGIQAAISGTVDFTPWLDLGTDTQAGTVGFQGDFSHLHVSASSPQVLAMGRIQEGIDLVADGSLLGGDRVIDVLEGEYSEDLVADKPLQLLGPNAAINPNTGSRVTEAVIHPASSDPDPETSSVVVIYIESDEVTVKGLTLDGDNPLLTSSVDMRGADVDAIEAIASYEGVGSITIANNILLNVSYAGLDFYNWANSGGATSDSYVQDNMFDNIGYTPDGWGMGILIYNNFYADITGNVMTQVRKGIQTGNFYAANPGGTASIRNNTIESTRFGLFYNLHYGSASPFVISDNRFTVTDESGPGAALRWDALVLSSQQGAASATIQDNTITGASVSQTTVGYQVWNCPSTGSLTIQGGSVTDCDYGAWVNNFDGYTSDGASTTMTLNGVTIVAASAAGVYVKDNPLNSNGAFAHAMVTGNCSISGGAVGVLVEGSDAGASVINNSSSITDNAVGILVDGGVALIENNNLTDNTDAGIRAQNGAKVDAGDCTGSNFSGLGTGSGSAGSSAGLNDLSGYLFDDAVPNAIENLNSGGPVLLAHNNVFGAGPGDNIRRALVRTSPIWFTQTGGLLLGSPTVVSVQCVGEIPTAVTTSDAFLVIGGLISCDPVTIAAVDVPPAPPSGNVVVTRTYTVTDVCGATAQCVQTITVEDTTAPLLAGTPVPFLSIDCNQSLPAPPTVTATDNCDGSVPVQYTTSTIGSGCPRTFVRTWTAIDSHGNTAAFVQVITEAKPPTAAELDYFTATSAGPRQVALDWRTLVEIQVIGFHVDRQTDSGAWERVTSGLIPAEGTDQRPHVYAVADRDVAKRTGLRYRLVELNLSGEERVVAETELVLNVGLGVARHRTGISLEIQGEAGSRVNVEAATELTTGDWTQIESVTLDHTGKAMLLRPAPESEPARFYRVRTE